MTLCVELHTHTHTHIYTCVTELHILLGSRPTVEQVPRHCCQPQGWMEREKEGKYGYRERWREAGGLVLRDCYQLGWTFYILDIHL